jgi:hypothetical protein
MNKCEHGLKTDECYVCMSPRYPAPSNSRRRTMDKEHRCPHCEYHKQRAALWRAEAYKLGGYDGIELPWKGLTDEERNTITRHHAYVDDIIKATEAKLKEKNT